MSSPMIDGAEKLRCRHQRRGDAAEAGADQNVRDVEHGVRFPRRDRVAVAHQLGEFARAAGEDDDDFAPDLAVERLP